MAMQSPELNGIVTGIVCLSTPFFQATPNDFEYFIKQSKESLSLGAVAISSFAYFASIDFLSNKFPKLQEPAMWVYAVLLLSAMTTSAAAHCRSARFLLGHFLASQVKSFFVCRLGLSLHE